MLLKSTLLWQDLMMLAPSFKIVDNWIPPSARNDPHHVFVTFVGLLVFGIGRYKCKVTRY